MAYAPARSQFSDSSIPMSDAISLCGPAAAIAFSSVNGRAPTLKEAREMARQVGWTPENGMAGPASEQALLAKMGVQAELAPSADWNRVTQDVAGGKPVIISTPRHYFTVSGYDPAKGYYVGTSGTDLKGGAEWMTSDEITSQGRGVNGALHLGTAQVSPNVTSMSPNATSPHRSAIQAAFGDLGPGVVDNMLAIVGKESGGNPAAHKNDDIEDSRGIGQVNARAHPDLAQKYDLFDPAQNARAMREIYDAQGYGAWKNASTQLGLAAIAATPTVPRAQQQFLEANAPGESTVPTPATGTHSRPPADPTAEPQKYVRDPELVALEKNAAWARSLMAEVPDNEPLSSGYKLPGLATPELGWKRFQLPRAGY